jgi:hypothetical protein
MELVPVVPGLGIDADGEPNHPNVTPVTQAAMLRASASTTNSTTPKSRLLKFSLIFTIAVRA